MRPTVTLSLGLAGLLACVAPEKPSGFGVSATGGSAPATDPGTTSVPAGTVTGESASGSQPDLPPDDPTAGTTGTTTTAAAPPDLPPDGTGSTTDTTAGSSGTGGHDPTVDGEGQLCFKDGDCPDSAPYCGPDNGCHDGDEGDPCDDDDDCGKNTPSCVDEVCYDGNEGDPCVNDFDCGPGSPACVDDLCWDGQEGDPCDSHKDCAPFFGCADGECKQHP